jgi:hypothetical protein
MDRLKKLELDSFDHSIPEHIQNEATDALESGQVIFLPNLKFLLQPEETTFLSPHIVEPTSKNISYDRRNDVLSGTTCQSNEAINLKNMIKRYSQNTEKFMQELFPTYSPHLIQARTSFRPVEASGRIQSYKKDDTRLHVDAFPSSPTHGMRIIRFFTNVNPSGKPRVWRLGEPFPDVIKKQAPHTSKPFPGIRAILKALKITKSYRSLYDHYMLQIHDHMKGDVDYQKAVSQQEFLFPPGSSWIVFSDQVSHAAMSGQHMFEQTFHIPVKGMKNPEMSPLKVMEKYYGKELV